MSRPIIAEAFITDEGEYDVGSPRAAQPPGLVNAIQIQILGPSDRESYGETPGTIMSISADDAMENVSVPVAVLHTLAQMSRAAR